MLVRDATVTQTINTRIDSNRSINILTHKVVSEPSFAKWAETKVARKQHTVSQYPDPFTREEHENFGDASFVPLFRSTVYAPALAVAVQRSLTTQV